MPARSLSSVAVQQKSHRQYMCARGRKKKWFELEFKLTEPVEVIEAPHDEERDRALRQVVGFDSKVLHSLKECAV